MIRNHTDHRKLTEQNARIAELEADRKDLMKRLWTSEEKAAGLEAELAALKDMTVALRAFLHVGDVVTVHTEGRAGSLTFSMDRFASVYGHSARAEGGSDG